MAGQAERLPLATSVGSSAAWIERWLTEPFEDAGWRGIARRMMLVAVVGSVSWAGVAMTIGGLAGRMSGPELLWAVLINEAATAIALGVAAWSVFRDVAVLEAWDAVSRPAAEASRVLRLVLTTPARIINRGLAAYVVVGLPVLWTWFVVTVEPLTLAIAICIGGFLAATLVTWAVAVFVAELSTRPVIARICAEFPQVAAPQGHGLSLRARALIPVPCVTLTTGISVGGLVGRFDEPAEQLVAAIAISLGFTVVIAVLLRFAVTEAALRPVDDLIEGVERIAEGDLRSRVPITGADELAVLGRAVNDMTERLAAHDAELRASRARIVSASDESRRMVERDLHDGAQQYLVLLQLKLGQARRIVDTDPRAAAAALDDASEELAHALSELRDLAHGIYPAVLESDGLPAALAAAADRSSIAVTVDSDGLGRYPQELEAAIYFCCLEALQNAAKHAGDGAKVTVRLGQDDGRVEFTIADDGRGYDADAVGPSAGLQNMADRIGALGGELEIESTPGAGTVVRGSVPIEVTR
jgi:signal transduction histidine kinase